MTSSSPAPRAASTIRNVLLLLLASAGGAVDAAGYAGIARVFTANMTGNTVLLGVALGMGERSNLSLVSATLIGFALGVFVGTLLSGDNKAVAWTGRITTVLALEWLILVGILVGWHAVGEPSRMPFAQLALLCGTALAMGMQSAAVRKLSVTGVATTYMTGTITTLMARLAERRPAATNADRGSQRLLFAVWLVYVAGAAGAAVLVEWANSWAMLLPLLLIALVVAGGLVFRPAS